MKNLSVFICSILIQISIHSQQDRFWQNPYPNGNSFYGIEYVNASNCWLITAQGFIYKTTNSG